MTFTHPLYALVFPFCAVAFTFLSGIGTKTNFWDYRLGFCVLGLAVILAMASIATSTQTLFTSSQIDYKHWITNSLAIMVSFAIILVPASWTIKLISYPIINDVTTDFENPPKFTQEQSTEAYKIPESPKEEGFTKQTHLNTYPEIRSFSTSFRKKELWNAILIILEKMKIRVTAQDFERGLIAGTYQSSFFGFTDDFIVRVKSATDRNIVDVRSKSRVGMSDLGENAKRVKKFLNELKISMQETK